MEHHLLGQACALLAALTWAFALVLFKRSGEQIPPLALNLFKNTVGIILLAATLLATRDGVDSLRGFQQGDIYLLLVSGIIGIAVADTVFFYGLNLIGVGIISIVDCLYTPFVILFSWLWLSEELIARQYVGAALILAAVLIASRHRPPADRTRAQLAAGILLGALAMALMAIGIVIAKRPLERLPLVWATTLRLLAGTTVLAVFVLALPSRAALWSVFRPSAVWKTCLPAAVLGAYVSMLLWIGGFKYTYASVAAVLNQTTTIFAIILATVILKESFTLRKVAAVLLAMTGVALATVAVF